MSKHQIINELDINKINNINNKKNNKKSNKTNDLNENSFVKCPKCNEFILRNSNSINKHKNICKFNSYYLNNQNKYNKENDEKNEKKNSIFEQFDRSNQC